LQIRIGEEISKEEVILITEEHMEGSKPKKKVTHHKKLKTKGDRDNQGKLMEEDEEIVSYQGIKDGLNI